ncbi:MAG: CRISPR-associated endonuclease Cas2 [Blastocatellia bacterium]|nr:CRISPR-associated endonuclease Cas2 [Blastocatellia bacterium]
MFIVLAYDIADNRRRTRLHKALKRFGTAVQYSVFEFHLNAAQLLRLKQFVAREIEPQEDHVRYYYLCEQCQQRLDTTPCSHRTSNPFALIS